jgi:Ion channel
MPRMLAEILQVIALVVLSTALHGSATAMLVSRAYGVGDRLRQRQSGLFRSFFVPGLVLILLLVGLVEATLWACYYFWSGLISTFPESLYFSLVTMTTVGYGDVVLEGSGRLIGGIQAALGIVLFGWTTSIIFAAVQALHVTRPREQPDELRKGLAGGGPNP